MKEDCYNNDDAVTLFFKTANNESYRSYEKKKMLDKFFKSLTEEKIQN